MAGIALASDLASHESHGIRRQPEYIERARQGVAKPEAKPEIVLDTGPLIRLDGQRAFGHIALRDATYYAAMERARAHGVAALGIRNAEHAGRLAEFC